MVPNEAPRRLIVNADDFGRSAGINQAVARAHCGGILTSASLMVNESAAAEAAAIAREHPRLGVGLHLALVCGRAALPPHEAPGLVGEDGQFDDNPVAAGMRYFFSRGLRAKLKEEMNAQFERFHATGLELDHVNGHLNIHLHPVVFDLLMENAGAWGIRRVRLTDDRFFLSARLAQGRWGYRVTHALIYRLLARRSRSRLVRRGVRFARNVFGLLQNGRVNEDYILNLLPCLPPGDSELYSHPSVDLAGGEFEALTSPRVGALIRQLGIELIRHQDL